MMINATPAVQQANQPAPAYQKPYEDAQFGLVVTRHMGFEEWNYHLMRLSAFHKMIEWRMIDLFTYGEQVLGEQVAASEFFNQRSLKTFQNYRAVARRFPLAANYELMTDEQRAFAIPNAREEFAPHLSLSHFSAVASKKLHPDAAMSILRRAASEHWNVEETRDAVRAMLNPSDEDKPETVEIEGAIISVDNGNIIIRSADSSLIPTSWISVQKVFRIVIEELE